MPMYGVLVFFYGKKKWEKYVAVTERHAVASYWAGMLAWYCAMGPVAT